MQIEVNRDICVKVLAVVAIVFIAIMLTTMAVATTMKSNFDRSVYESGLNDGVKIGITELVNRIIGQIIESGQGIINLQDGKQIVCFPVDEEPEE